MASPGTAGVAFLRGVLEQRQRHSRAWQDEERRRTGYVTGHAETGHRVHAALQDRGYLPSVCAVAAHLAAVGSEYNWQGNVRIASLVGRSERTVQRARARLEADGWIRSELLLTGDMIQGQRSPVRHPQVVRHVAHLQRLARVRATPQPPRRRRPSAIDRPAPPSPSPPATAEDFEELARDRPEYATFFSGMAAAAKRPTAPADGVRPLTPTELDALDTELAELTREIERQRERERGPPK